MKKNIWILLTLFFHTPLIAEESNFKFKDINDIKTLETYESIKDFEIANTSYIQECLNNWGGSLPGTQCFIGYQIWDRELNIIYKRLHSSLDEKSRVLLKDSQKAWIKSRDLSSSFIYEQVNKKYADETGTMYRFFSASDAADAITPIIKERTLILHSWLNLIEDRDI